MTTPPNIYEFATSELSQDATLAYILSYSKSEHREGYADLNRLGKLLLRSLARAAAEAQGITSPLQGKPIEKIEIKTQDKGIDVSVKVNDAIWLIIEDKIMASEHSDQINRYVRRAKQSDGGRWHVMPVYVKTGNESRPGSDLPHGIFLRKDLLAVLDQAQDIDNTIVREFREHLVRWEKLTDSFRHKSCDQWTRESLAKEGYYMALELWLGELQDNTPHDPGWGYVSNQSGGFLGFWWHWRIFERCPCSLY
ncbi:MAG: PD-(D/E)XK nuclease family protein, partial [bacterium]